MSYATLRHDIDGQRVGPTGTSGQSAANPAIDAVIGRLGHASREALDRAIQPYPTGTVAFIEGRAAKPSYQAASRAWPSRQPMSGKRKSR